ncbi:MAG: cation-translocating P-type ATPase, partial [Corallococcus sp.]|nr:cation-translocating P-type ATPase [Corallococcus sp.]
MKKDTFADKKVSEVYNTLATSPRGLTQSEASARIMQHGRNLLPTKKKHSALYKFFSQFADLMIVILLISAVISFVLAAISGDGKEFIEPVVIVGIVFVNAALGYVQQCKAEKSLEHLAKLSSPKVKVLRDGQLTTVADDELTIGDVIVLEAGDMVSADARLTESVDLKVNESALTGESLPVDKNARAVLRTDVSLAHRVNCVYRGSFVTFGRATAVVTAIGGDTEMGKIAVMLKDTSNVKTPLEEKMSQLSKVIGAVCLCVCAAVFLLGFVKGVKNMKAGESILSVFMEVFTTSVSLAVAAIPEGLPAVVTIVLANSVERMVKHRAIVKNMTAVETLGSASVICTDKTGTLTQNVMTARMIFDGKSLTEAENADKNIIKAFVNCCDAVKSADGVYFGDPTEIALVRLGEKAGIVSRDTRVYEVPFSSERKMMSVVVKSQGKYICITKGSYENMSAKCTNASDFAAQYDSLSSKGMRVLALAAKSVEHNFVKNPAIENNLDMIAIVALIDPPRDGVKDAVETCLSAGIRPVMITGDSIATATEIARQLGIMSPSDKAVTGKMLSEMSDKQLASQVRQIAVYARVTPADKLRIVNAWQSLGEVVAMTGDGVNDAPALKRADIGCAMGKGGSEVAKNTADMILADDNFSTIVEAVATGRGVYDNIKKSVRYLLSCNIGEVLSVFVSLLIWNVSPLGAMQLLLVNLVTDGLPSLALGIEKRESDVMLRPPKGKRETFFSNGQGWHIALGGVAIGAITVIAYAIGNTASAQHGVTMSYFVLSVSQLFFALEVSSKKSLFRGGVSLLTAAAAAVSALVVVATMFIPPLQSGLGLTALPMYMYLWALGLSVFPVVCFELYYAISAIRKFVGKKGNQNKMSCFKA